jgi:hypothetical protein
MAAKTRVATRRERARSMAVTALEGTGIQASAKRRTAASPMLMMKEVRSRNPMMRTSPRERRRVVTKTRKPLREGLATTPQNWFREDCIWARTVVAPNRSIPPPRRVGRSPPSSMRELRTASSTASAAWAPRRASTCVYTSALAESAPRTAPTMAMMMMSMGAREKRV